MTYGLAAFFTDVLVLLAAAPDAPLLLARGGGG